MAVRLTSLGRGVVTTARRATALAFAATGRATRIVTAATTATTTTATTTATAAFTALATFAFLWTLSIALRRRGSLRTRSFLARLSRRLLGLLLTGLLL